MVPSRLIFSLGSACSGTGGAGASRVGESSPSPGRQSSSPPLSGTMVSVLESSFGLDMMGRAVEPGFGGGSAGAARGNVSPRLEVLSFTTGGGGALRCGTPVCAASCCTVGCTKATLGPL